MKIEGLLNISSNSPTVATGYGQQINYFLERAVKTGLELGVMSNFGLSGNISQLQYGKYSVKHYPRGENEYSDDVLAKWHDDFRLGKEDLKHAIFTLYDVWVYRTPAVDFFPFISWLPTDHIKPPQYTIDWAKKENVTPITMSLHGYKELKNLGINNYYIPHGIDTKKFERVESYRGLKPKQIIGVDEKTFLIGMVAVNKKYGHFDRKAYAENLAAISEIMKKYPNVMLYIHAEPTRKWGGSDLELIIRKLNIDPDRVIFSSIEKRGAGYDHEHLSLFYSAFDVLLAPSYGEGFGLPAIEALSCATPIVVSDWSAHGELSGQDIYKVSGQLFWDDDSETWYKVPIIENIISALEKAIDRKNIIAEEGRKIAEQFDFDKIWQEKWLPFLTDYFSK